jgi:hypothetical protein
MILHASDGSLMSVDSSGIDRQYVNCKQLLGLPATRDEDVLL